MAIPFPLRLYHEPVYVGRYRRLGYPDKENLRVSYRPPYGHASSISSNSPPSSNLNPGGWAEFQDPDVNYRCDDGTLTEEHSLRKWVKVFMEGITKAGREPSPGPKLRALAEKAGFVNIREQVFKVPLGPWAKDPDLKETGMINLTQQVEGLEGFSLKVFDLMGWSRIETEVLLAQVRNELKGRAFHAYTNL